MDEVFLKVVTIRAKIIQYFLEQEYVTDRSRDRTPFKVFRKVFS